METFIDAIIKRYSRLCVVKLNLRFREDSNLRNDFFYAQECFKRFLNNRRNNSIFNDEVAYIWSIHYGKDIGFHYHLLLIFNGHKRQQDRSIGFLIGRYWVYDITDDNGGFYCSNDSINVLRKKGLPVGIGRVNRKDEEECNSLKLVANLMLRYTDEENELFSLMVPETAGAFRRFGRTARLDKIQG